MKHGIHRSVRRSVQLGVTLVELLVSLFLVSLITLAVLALYNTSANAYKTTDANQELSDNARFIVEIFSQSIRQAGLQDAAQYAAFQAQNQPVLAPSYLWDVSRFGAQPALFGYNNANVANPTSGTDFGANDNVGVNNSDVFGVRYFGSSRLSDASTADGSIIDCRGVGVPYPINQGDIGLSLFMVATGASGEPELMCINAGRAQAFPIVAGVESLQLMYGVDTDPATDTTPNRWLNAKQVADAALWTRVRTVRLGLVLRGAPGSGVTAPTPQVLYPMGEEFSKIGGVASTESGMTFTPPNDGRLRRAYTFNIAVRNTVEQ